MPYLKPIKILCTNFPMVIWWVMFCEIIPHILASWFPINEKVLFLPCPSSNKIACTLPWTFLSNYSGDNTFGYGVVCFIGVDGWVKPSSWSVILRGTDVCPLWNSPTTSASAADATTCLRILHSVWIGPFYGGGRFGDFLDWLVVS